jgi:hypothetical protein
MGKVLKPLLALAGVVGVIAAVLMFRPRSLYTVDGGQFSGFDWKGGIERSPYWARYFEQARQKPDFKKPLLHFSVTSEPVSGLEAYGVLRYGLRATSHKTGALVGEGTLDSKPEGIDDNRLTTIANTTAGNAFARQLSADASFAPLFKSMMPGGNASLEEIEVYTRACAQAGRSAMPVLDELMGLLDHGEVNCRKAGLDALRVVVPKKDDETWGMIYEKLLKDEDHGLYGMAWEDVIKDGRKNAQRIAQLAVDRKDEAIRLEALWVLMALGPHGAGGVAPLAKLLKDPECPNSLRRPAVLALSSMLSGDPAAMSVLRDVAKKPDDIAADIAKQGFFAHTLPGSTWRVHDGGKGYRLEFRGNGRFKVRNLATNSVGYGNYRFKKGILLAGRLRGELAIDGFNIMVSYEGVYDTEPNYDGPEYEGRWQFHREKR